MQFSRHSIIDKIAEKHSLSLMLDSDIDKLIVMAVLIGREKSKDIEDGCQCLLCELARHVVECALL